MDASSALSNLTALLDEAGGSVSLRTDHFLFIIGETNHASPSSHVRPSNGPSSSSRLSFNSRTSGYNSRGSLPNGPQRGVPNKEWKLKSINNIAPVEPSNTPPAKTDSVSSSSEHATYSTPAPGPNEHASVVTEVERKLDELEVSERQHVIISNHLGSAFDTTSTKLVKQIPSTLSVLEILALITFPGLMDAPSAPSNLTNYFSTYGYLYCQKEMLSDRVRMDMYFHVVSKNRHYFCVKAVLNVGTVSGIIAIWCPQAGSRKVHAVEATKMAYHARDLVKGNRIEDVVEVIEGSMEDITLLEKIDVKISEWMGYFLRRESMLDFVICARDWWLKPGRVMKEWVEMSAIKCNNLQSGKWQFSCSFKLCRRLSSDAFWGFVFSVIS